MLQRFQENRTLNEGEGTLLMGTEAKVDAFSIGTFNLVLEGVVLFLKNRLYVPEIRRNLVSISKLAELGYSILFHNKVAIKFNNKFVTSGFIGYGTIYDKYDIFVFILLRLYIRDCDLFVK